MTIKKTTLPSGILLITVPVKATKTVTVMVAAQAGSNVEKKEENGISHFLEHMMFKGTKKRPTTLAISEELDGVGGVYNAFTGKEWTAYYAKADSQHLDLLLDVISDMYINATLKSVEAERERLVILEEMNMYQDTPVHYVDDLVEGLLYGDEPQGWKIIGERKTVKAITAQKLKRYFGEKYIAKNTVVVVVGNIDEKLLRSQVNNYFALIPKQGSASQYPKIKEHQTKPQIKLHYKKTDQTHLSIALRAYRAGDKKLPALQLLNIILGGNMSSRLFINIREREGLGYYISSSVEMYKDVGYLSIKAGVDNKRARKAVALIMKELKIMRDDGVKDSELKKAKDYVRGKLALSLETTDAIAFWLGSQQLVEGKIKTPQEVIREIDAVTRESIHAVAKEIIGEAGLNMVMISPFKDMKKFAMVFKL